MMACVCGRTFRVLCLFTALFLTSISLWAHHVPEAKFDPDQRRTLQGSVSKVDWLNPHVHIFLEVEQGGSTVSWAVELESTIDLKRNGWTSDSVAPGDQLRVDGMLARDGSRQIWGSVVTAEATGRQLFTVEPAQPPVYADRDAPTPRWPDGQPRLGPPAGQVGGYWDFPSKPSLVEDGVDVVMDSFGLLDNLDDAGKVAPFQQWSLDLYKYRQQNYLKDDPMFQDCKTQAGPRIFQRPYGVVLLEEREHQRIRNFWGGGNQNWRMIFLDGREQTGFLEGNADDPLYWGHAVGEWEGDTLVIDTIGFNDKFWFSNGGLPHTSQLHLVERFSRPDMNTLLYQVTVDDPGAYTRPWTASWTMKWVPDSELPVYFCQDNRP